MSLSPSITDPIASEVGHGAMGLRDGLRPFSELVLASASQKHVYACFKPVRYISGWSNDTTAGVYLTSFSETWAGIRRDVIGVRTLNETLVRAETLALCRSTAGTYYYDPEQTDTGRRWDDGTLWDAGLTWDGVPVLYVNLTGSASPNATEVVAQLGFYYGSHSVVQPQFGPEKAVAGSWASTAAGAGGGSAAVTSRGGTITGSINAAGGRGVAQAGMVAVQGAVYRVSGTYSTDAALAAGLEARLRVGSGFGVAYVESGGRTTGAAATGFALALTYGQTRRFSFDFVWPNADTTDLQVLAMAWNTSGGALTCAGVTFDSLSVCRIWRFVRYEARLSMESVPAIETKRADAFFGPTARGSGTLTLANGNGHFEALFGGLDWVGQMVVVAVGGRFVDGGNEAPLEDAWQHITGIIGNGPTLTDAAFALPFEDMLARLQTQLPPNSYDLPVYPDLAQADIGRRRPLLFGAAKGVRAARISKGTGLNLGLPVYELCDLSAAVNTAPITGLGVWSYVDDAAAQRQDASRRVLLDGFPAAWTKPIARVDFTGDVRVIEVKPGVNDALTFVVAGTGYTAVMPAGLYTWAGSLTRDLPTAIRAALNAAGAGAIFNLPTYDLSTGGKATITASVAFQIARASDPWQANSFWPDLGWTTQADTVAATSQTSDTGMFVDCDSQIFLRFDLGQRCGFLDDSAGSWTSVPDFIIIRAGDVLRFLLVRLAGVERGLIDEASFDAARVTCPEYHYIYIGAPDEGALELPTIIERIENGAGADLSFNGGRFYFTKRDNSAAGAVDLVERDYLDFSSYQDADDVFGVVRIAYGREASTGNWRTTQRTSSAATARFGRLEQRTFETYIPPDVGTGYNGPNHAAARLATFAGESTAKRRRYSVTVKGKLFQAALGSKVRLTRAKGADSSGALASVLCRIVGKRDDPNTFETTADLIEVV